VFEAIAWRQEFNMAEMVRERLGKPFAPQILSAAAYAHSGQQLMEELNGATVAIGGPP
jgi:hypothetical protein